MDDILEELGRFDDGFEPFVLDIEAGIDTLPDGAYEFEIVAAELTRTPQTREAIFRMKLRVLAGVTGTAGNIVERVNFFAKQQSINSLGGDLVALGFPADRWTRANGQSFAAEFGKVIPQMKGLKFAGRKATTKPDDNGKTYHNLHIRNRIGTTPTKSSPRPAALPRPASQPALPNTDSSDVPF